MILLVNISHSATGMGNPVNWRIMYPVLYRYYNVTNILPNRIRSGDMTFCETHQEFQLQWFFRYYFPASVFATFANMFGSRKTQALAQTVKRAVNKAGTYINYIYILIQYLY